MQKSAWKAGEGLEYMVGNAVFPQESAPLKSIKDLTLCHTTAEKTEIRDF